MIQIRKLTTNDLSTVKEICELGFPEDDAFEIVESMIDREHFYVAEEIEKEKVLGFVIFGIKSIKAAHVYVLAVHQEQARKGIGSQLLEFTLKKLQESHKKLVQLEVRITNIAAIRFYEKNGFKIHSTLKNYYEDNSNGYLMIREI